MTTIIIKDEFKDKFELDKEFDAEFCGYFIANTDEIRLILAEKLNKQDKITETDVVLETIKFYKELIDETVSETCEILEHSLGRQINGD